MKKMIAIVLCLALALSMVGCRSVPIPGSGDTTKPVTGGADMPIVNDVVNIEQPQVALNESKTNIELVNIVDLTVVNQLSTDCALEKFCKDNDYTYYFPTIKSEYIECQFTNGDKMTIVEALNNGKVTISDLDTYGIFYWKVDKNGNYIKSSDKQKPCAVEQSSIVWNVKDIINDIGPVSLSVQESKKVKDIIDSCKYEIETSGCDNDFQFIKEDGNMIYYHSECGTFNDIENNKSYALLDGQKECIGTLLSKYLVVMTRTPNQEYPIEQTQVMCEGVSLAPESFTKP